MNARRLIFTGKQAVELEEFALPAPGPDEVLVQTVCSLMSTGTENIVFNRLFDAGTHWDKWVKYPFKPGYACVGEVLAVGAGVVGLKPGARVAYRTGHCSHALVKEPACFPIPAEVPLTGAAWFALAKITYHGVHAAKTKLGDRVLIIGAGPIGQMSTRWAIAAGARKVTVVDLAGERLVLARAGGATAVIGEPIDRARESILAANDGVLPNIVIDSTGNAAVFTAALSVVADQGRVVVLGDTGTPTQQALTSDVITRGITIIGAHDGVQIPNWPQPAIVQLFFDLAATGRFPLAGLDSHHFAPEDCANAYATANRERSTTMGLVFDWAEAGKA